MKVETRSICLDRPIVHPILLAADLGMTAASSCLIQDPVARARAVDIF